MSTSIDSIIVNRTEVIRSITASSPQVDNERDLHAGR